MMAFFQQNIKPECILNSILHAKDIIVFLRSHFSSYEKNFNIYDARALHLTDFFQDPFRKG